MNVKDRGYQELIEENSRLKLRIHELERLKSKRQLLDDALLGSEAECHFVLDHTADIISITNMDLQSTYVSSSVFRILGFTVEEAMQRTLEQIFTPESLQRVRSVLAEEMKQEESGTADPQRVRSVEAEEYKKDGSRIWMEISLSYLRNKKGTLTGLLTVSRDISMRKAAEAELRESEEKFRALVENSRDAIVRFDRDHRHLYVNPVVREQMGIPPEEFIGKTHEELGFPRDLCSLFHKTIEQTFLSGQVNRLETQLPNGRWVDWMLMPEKDESGQVKAVITSARDIARRKENEVLLNTLFQAAPLAIYVVDEKRNLIKVNDYNWQTFGYQPEEMIGRNTRFLFFSDEDYLEAGKAISSNHATKEVRMKRKDGEEIHALFSRSYLNGRDFSQGCIVIVQDITDRRAMADQLRQAQKMEAIGQLAGGVAHDFNNILQAILGYTQMMLISLAPEDKNCGMLKEVEKAGEKAAALTRQLLAFSRRQVLQLGPLDLNRTIDDLMKMLRRLIGENIDLHLSPNSALWMVNADRGQMEQVIINLCVNARDAMPEGGRLSIETRNVQLDDDYCVRHEWAKPGRYVRLSITDSGCGMDRETKRKIFEPFFTTKEQGRGTGLGLATVYGIVRQHDGMIHVSSAIGKGSEFSIYLPVTERTEEILTKTQGPVLGGRETILLAEDDEPLRFLAEKILKLAGYRVHAAVDGEDALRLYRDHKQEIDLLLMDVVMPRKGGCVVYDEIRAVRPDIPCIFMSGYSENAMRIDFVLDQGFNLIQKPFNSADLLRLLRKELDRSQLDSRR